MDKNSDFYTVSEMTEKREKASKYKGLHGIAQN